MAAVGFSFPTIDARSSPIFEISDTNPIGHPEDEEEIGTNKIGRWIWRAMESKSYEELKQEKWQGKFLKQRWENENLDNDSFQWMTEWKTAPMYMHNRGLARVISTAPSDQSLSSEKDGNQYHHRETVEHVMAGCSALAQTKYMARRNAALKIVYFELVTEYDLAESLTENNSTSVQVCPCLRGESKSKLNWCSYHGQSKKGDSSVGDELPMDNKSKNKGRREDKEVCTTSVGIETTISTLSNKATKHHNMKVKVMFRKFECREDIHYKTQTGTSCEKCNSKVFRLGIEDASSGILDWPVLYHWVTEAVADNLGASPVYISMRW